MRHCIDTAITEWKNKCICARFKIGKTVINGKVVEWDPYIHPTSVYYQCEKELEDHIEECPNPDCPYKNMTDKEIETLLPYWP